MLAVKLPRERLIEAGAWFRHEFAKRNQKGIEVKLANAVWAQQGQKVAAGLPGGPQDQVRHANRGSRFPGRPQQARQLINQWAARQTNDKIKDYLPEGEFSNLTMMVLANALYFKGRLVRTF